MIVLEKNNVKTLVFKSFKDKGVLAGYTTRLGGVSKNEYQSLNFATNKGDDRESVIQNYHILADTLGFDFANYVLSDQVHDDKILYIDSSYKGKFMQDAYDIKGVDGFFTKEKDIVLTTFYADCTPLYFYDDVIKLIGVAHSGWRGTAKNIAQKMIDEFIKRGSKPQDIIVGIGPCICGKCFEVQDDVIDSMKEYSYITECYQYNQSKDRYYLDMKKLNKLHILAAGVLEKNIEIAENCTFEEENLFFSHRRSADKRGSQIGIMYFENN